MAAKRSLRSCFLILRCRLEIHKAADTLLPLHDSALMDSIGQCYGHVVQEGLWSELIGVLNYIYYQLLLLGGHFTLPLLVGAEQSSSE